MRRDTTARWKRKKLLSQMSVEEKAEERILNLKAQIAAYEKGEQHSLTCPYCAGINRESEPFCCKMFEKASIAALERLRVEQSLELVEKIVERHAKN